MHAPSCARTRAAGGKNARLLLGLPYVVEGLLAALLDLVNTASEEGRRQLPAYRVSWSPEMVRPKRRGQCPRDVLVLQRKIGGKTRWVKPVRGSFEQIDIFFLCVCVLRVLELCFRVFLINGLCGLRVFAVFFSFALLVAVVPMDRGAADGLCSASKAAYSSSCAGGALSLTLTTSDSRLFSLPLSVVPLLSLSALCLRPCLPPAIPSSLLPPPPLFLVDSFVARIVVVTNNTPNVTRPHRPIASTKRNETERNENELRRRADGHNGECKKKLDSLQPKREQKGLVPTLTELLQDTSNDPFVLQAARTLVGRVSAREGLGVPGTDGSMDVA